LGFPFVGINNVHSSDFAPLLEYSLEEHRDCLVRQRLFHQLVRRPDLSVLSLYPVNVGDDDDDDEAEQQRKQSMAKNPEERADRKQIKVVENAFEDSLDWSNQTIVQTAETVDWWVSLLTVSKMCAIRNERPDVKQTLPTAVPSSSLSVQQQLQQHQRSLRSSEWDFTMSVCASWELRGVKKELLVPSHEANECLMLTVLESDRQTGSFHASQGAIIFERVFLHPDRRNYYIYGLKPFTKYAVTVTVIVRGLGTQCAGPMRVFVTEPKFQYAESSHWKQLLIDCETRRAFLFNSNGPVFADFLQRLQNAWNTFWSTPAIEQIPWRDTVRFERNNSHVPEMRVLYPSTHRGIQSELADIVAANASSSSSSSSGSSSRIQPKRFDLFQCPVYVQVDEDISCGSYCQLITSEVVFKGLAFEDSREPSLLVRSASKPNPFADLPNYGAAIATAQKFGGGESLIEWEWKPRQHHSITKMSMSTTIDVPVLLAQFERIQQHNQWKNTWHKLCSTDSIVAIWNLFGPFSMREPVAGNAAFQNRICIRDFARHLHQLATQLDIDTLIEDSALRDFDGPATRWWKSIYNSELVNFRMQLHRVMDPRVFMTRAPAFSNTSLPPISIPTVSISSSGDRKDTLSSSSSFVIVIIIRRSPDGYCG
jgi:hypothetical protein